MHPVPRVASVAVEVTAVYVATAIAMKVMVNNELNFLATVEDYCMKSMLKTEEISSLFVTFVYNVAYALI
jgi:hypothetical protein